MCLKVLQNIQDVNFNCLRSGNNDDLDPILKVTRYEKHPDDEELKISRQRQESEYDSVNDLIECFESLQPGNVGHDPSLTQRRLSFIADRVEIKKNHIQMKPISITNQNIKSLSPLYL